MMKISAALVVFIAIAIYSVAQVPNQRPSSSPEGSWQGALDVGQGQKLRLVLNISKNTDGSYTGRADSVDQGIVLPIDVITVNGDSVRLEFKSVGSVFDAKLSADGSELSGQFSQRGTVLPLTLKRVDSSTPAASSPTPTPSGTPQRPIDVPVDIAIPIAPAFFKGGGKTHIVYELHVTNFSRNACVLTRLEAVNAATQKQLVVFNGDELAARVVRPGVVTTTTEEKLKIGAGLRLIVHGWLTFDTPAEVPNSIQHKLSFKVGDYPEELSITTSKVMITKGPVSIGPPLRGSEWLAGNGPSNTSGHRRAMIPTGGGVHIAQRFAIDFVQLFPDGRSFSGDQKDNKNYRCYGAEALAVADGLVVATKDGIPENIPGATSRAVPITLETVGGNHVILDIGGGRYAFYAHLQPGSLRVKNGDKVRRGQVIGLVGNSGNSTEPHLHFHVSDANSPLAAEGVPYALPSFEVQGKGWGWKPTTPAAATEKRQNEMPVELEVIRFPN